MASQRHAADDDDADVDDADVDADEDEDADNAVLNISYFFTAHLHSFSYICIAMFRVFHDPLIAAFLCSQNDLDSTRKKWYPLYCCTKLSNIVHSVKCCRI